MAGKHHKPEEIVAKLHPFDGSPTLPAQLDNWNFTLDFGH
jgi:hypothetical protein